MRLTNTVTVRVICFALVLSCCHGVPADPAPSADATSNAGEPVSQPSPIDASQAVPGALTERVRVSLPYGQARPIPALGGTVTLLDARSKHLGPRLVEASSGVIALCRNGETLRLAFGANRAFEAWGYRMAVFGASGSYELSVFPPGATLQP